MRDGSQLNLKVSPKKGRFSFVLRTVPIAIILAVFSLAHAEAIYKKACFKSVCVRAEVADTDPQRQAGLMFRKHLPRKHAMLFVFEREGVYPFWMKNMKFPLDIIWFSKDKQVVYIAKNVQPCRDACESIAPDRKARFVLEVNAGFTDKYKIKIQDRAKF
jgi:uncharacterized protein